MEVDKNSIPKNEIYAILKAYVNSGLSVIPIRSLKNKNPFIQSWQTHRSTIGEVDQWTKQGHVLYGVVCGEPSGNLEVIDFDEKYEKGIFEQWLGLLSTEVQAVVKTLPLAQTQNAGNHVFYRCKNVSGNLKLARRPYNPVIDGDDLPENERGPKTTIETRGIGGQVLAYPTPGYTLEQGRLTEIPIIDAEIRDAMWVAARALNKVYREPEREHWSQSHGDQREKPGDDFNARASWDEILGPHGWKKMFEKNSVIYLTRPGKDHGISATINYGDHDALYIFSTNATPFEAERGYKKFYVYTLLNHKGDFSAAAKELAAQGYGSKSRDETKKVETDPEKFKFTPLSTLLEEPEEEIGWIVDNLLPSAGFSIIVAKPKVGKSTLARQIALSVARGEMVLGRETIKGPVLYVSLEEKRSEVKNHFRIMGATGEESLSVYIGSVPREAFDWLKKEVEEVHPILVIVDTLFRFAQVSDVNDYAKITDALTPLLDLAREKSAHLMCVHHARKGGGEGGDSTLGSTAIFGSVDTAVVLKKTEGRRTIETQQRYGTDMEQTVLLFDPDSKTATLGGTKEEADIQKAEGAILEFLQSEKTPVAESVINAEVDCRTGLQRKALRNLVAKNQVVRTGAGRKGDPYLYSCSLVPNIYTGTGEQETKSDQKTNDEAADYRSDEASTDQNIGNEILDEEDTQGEMDFQSRMEKEYKNFNENW